MYFIHNFTKQFLNCTRNNFNRILDHYFLKLFTEDMSLLISFTLENASTRKQHKVGLQRKLFYNYFIQSLAFST